MSNFQFFNKKISTLTGIIIIICALIIGGIFAYRWLSEQKILERQIENLRGIIPVGKKGHPKLDSVLNDLIQAKDYKKFVREQGLDITNSKVRVEIELVSADYVFPAYFGIEELGRYEKYIDAYVPIEKLRELANDQNVKFIMRPSYAVPLE